MTPYYARLDRWRLRCDEQNWVVARLQARLAQRAQLEPATPPLRPEEVYADLAGEFRARRAQMDEEAQTPPPEPTLSSADEDELRQLYRQLAKRFHPDLVATPGFRAHAFRMPEDHVFVAVLSNNEGGRAGIVSLQNRRSRHRPTVSGTYAGGAQPGGFGPI